jgi:hypothetical protein
MFNLCGIRNFVEISSWISKILNLTDKDFSQNETSLFVSLGKELLAHTRVKKDKIN